MRVLFVKPQECVGATDERAQWLEVSNEYEAYKKLVGGHVKVACTSVPGVYVAYAGIDEADNAVWGNVKEKTVNLVVNDKSIAGDVFFISFQNYFFAEVTDEQGKGIMEAYYHGAKIKPLG